MNEALLDTVRERASVGETEPAGEICGRQSARQLHEGEGVAPRLGEDPGLHLLVERTGNRRFQEHAGLVRREPLDQEFREPLKQLLDPEFAHGEHKPHPFRQEPASHEREGLRGHLVQPLRVVDDTHEWLLLRGVRQKAQDRQAYEEALRWRAVAQAESCPQRVALRFRQRRETVEQGCAQGVQTSERELHLRLDARRPADPASRGSHRYVPQ